MSLWDVLFGSNKSNKPSQPGYAASQHPVAPAPKPSGSMWDPVKKNLPPVPGPTAGNYTFPATPNASTGYKHGSKPSSSNVGGGGASGGGQAPAPVAPAFNAATMLPDPRNDLNPVYDAAMKRIMEMNSGLQGDFDKAIAATQAQYASSGSDLYNRYQGARADLDASAAGLGVQGDQVYKDYDPALRRVQENADTQRNASVDLLRTLQTLRQQQGVDVQASLEQQRAKALADQTAQWVDAITAMQAAATGGSSGGGGGGGGGRRGGGGSSGSAKESATMTEELYSVGDIEAYNNLLASGDTEGAAMYLASLQKSTGSPLIKQLATQADEIAKIDPKVAPKVSDKGGIYGSMWNKIFNASANVGTAINSAKKKNNQDTVQRAIAAAMPTSGLMGNPTNRAKITSSSSKKT